jgi:hypothetical protein
MNVFHLKPSVALAGLAAAIAISAGMPVHAKTVFSSNFDNGIPARIQPGTATTEGVQGYAGLGLYSAHAFGGQMLRSGGRNPVTLTLENLPPHKFLSIDFLFAAIDSWDGSGLVAPRGDVFNVKVDGVTVFRETFANATEDEVQSYVPSDPSYTLAWKWDLGFNQGAHYYADSAYALGREKAFRAIPHKASSATITFLMDGPGAGEAMDQESWGIDNLVVKTLKKPRIHPLGGR